MNLQPIPHSTGLAASLLAPKGYPASIEAVVLRHLRTPQEIDSILHLRENIDLSVLSGIDSDFLDLEKKETNSGSCSVSS